MNSADSILVQVIGASPGMETHDAIWTNPTLVAALVAGVVALTVAALNAGFGLLLQRERQKAEGRLARERFDFDRDLAERRVRLDRELGDWRRRAEFAEAELGSFYDARSRLEAIRFPGAFSTENLDRAGRDSESEAVRNHRDIYYPFARRIAAEADFFNDLHARRFRALALFGTGADAPYQGIWSALSQLRSAVDMLMRDNGAIYNEALAQHRLRMEERIWQGAADDDAVAQEIDEAVTAAETLLRPAILNLPA